MDRKGAFVETEEKILIVDDRAEDILPLMKALEKEYKVNFATSGRQAFKIAFSENQPDLILLDIVMPEMDGYEVLSTLKANILTRDIPVIFLTGSGEEREEIKALDIGAQDYIVKPFSVPVVIARIKSVLNLRREEERRRQLDIQLKFMNSQLGNRGRPETDQPAAIPEQLVKAQEKQFRHLLQKRPAGKPAATILIVDDDPQNFHFLRKNLESGYQLFFATTGERALEIASCANPPDVILLDIMMPGMDGYETLSKLQADPATRDIPVIFITARNQAVDEARSLSLGAADFIVKPFHMPVVKARIKAVLHMKDEMENRIGMTKSLADLNDSLEKQVLEKTVALQRAHKELQASEERYRNIYETAIEGIYQSTPDGRLLNASPSLARILGYTSSGELLSSIADISKQIYLNPDDRDTLKQLLKDKGETIGFETRLKKKNGDVIWVMISVRVVPQDPEYYQGAVIDITERKQTEEALRKTEAERELILNSTQNMVLYHDLDLKIVWGNQAAAKAMATKRESLHGRYCYKVWHHSDKICEQCPLESVRRTAKPTTAEIQSPDGRYWQIRGYPIKNEDGILIALAEFCTDITERRRSEQTNSRHLRELALLNKVIAASVTETVEKNILDVVCRELLQAFHLFRVSAYALDTEKTKATLEAESLHSEAMTRARPQADLGHALAVPDNPAFSELIGRLTPLVADQVRIDDRLSPVHDALVHPDTQSLVLLPWHIQGTAAGWLACESVESGFFAPENIDLAQSVADQVSGALARIRLDDERRQLEKQYFQAQKMEAIGRLTGGIAHDFNNMLTVIMLLGERLNLGLAKDVQLHPLSYQIVEAAGRAADLVRQLMAFSRQQVLQPTPVNLNNIIKNLKKMLGRIIGEDVEMHTMLDPALGQVKVDTGQMEQVLMNLAVNARDAMPSGGKLIVETANVRLDEDDARHHADVKPGDYIVLTVSDTGVGMDTDTLTRIFEPFFTTKATGKGTGLGLATTHGIVKQSGGHIWVYSEPGKGSNFRIYLPRNDEGGEASALDPSAGKTTGGSETVLVVEDEQAVRASICTTLEGFGYTVIQANYAEEADRVLSAHKNPVDLLLTDVNIPGGENGVQLAERLLTQYPSMKVLFMSGYTGNAIAHNGVLDEGVAFIQKPFITDDLACKVRDILDGK